MCAAELGLSLGDVRGLLVGSVVVPGGAAASGGTTTAASSVATAGGGAATSAPTTPAPGTTATAASSAATTGAGGATAVSTPAPQCRPYRRVFCCLRRPHYRHRYPRCFSGGALLFGWVCVRVHQPCRVSGGGGYVHSCCS